MEPLELPILPENLSEVIAYLKPEDWESISEVFPNINWEEVIRLSRINKEEVFLNAAEQGNFFLVDLMLEHGVDPSTRNNFAIIHASARGHLTILILLLSDPRVDPSAQNNAAISWAADGEHVAIIKLLLQDPRLGDDLSNVLHYATYYGNLELVELLLEDERVDPSVNENRAIWVASHRGHTDVVKLLLSDSRIDPSARNNGPLVQASLSGHTKVVELLLSDPRVDPSTQEGRALLLAAVNGYLPVVQLLVSDPRISREDISEAMQEASTTGHTAVVEFLIQELQSRPLPWEQYP